MAANGEWDEVRGAPVIPARVVVGAVTGGIVSFGVTCLVRNLAARIGLVDRPNARSSHVRPMPRGGGLGIVGGSCIGLLLVAAGDWDAAPWAILLGAML